MSCEGLSTGDRYTPWWMLGEPTVCIDYNDPATMRELKMMLAEVSGVATRVEATVWTQADEGALALANAEERFRYYELGRNNDVGWYVPDRETPVWLLFLGLGHPDNLRLYADYPLLTSVVDAVFYEGAAGKPGKRYRVHIGATEPRVGAAAAPATAKPEPLIPEPEEPWEAAEPYEPPYEEAAVVPISPMMLAGAALATLGLGFAVVYAIRS